MNISITIDNKNIPTKTVDYGRRKSQELDIQSERIDLNKMKIDLEMRKQELEMLRKKFDNGKDINDDK